MPELVQVAKRQDFATSRLAARRLTAVSKEAKAVETASSARSRRVEESEALFGRKAEAIAALRAVADSCAKADWNGEGALAVDRVAVSRAESLIRALPSYLPMPEPAVDPDGAISLDWQPSSRKMFSISVSRRDRLAFAWMDGADKGHAVARFDGLSIPSQVLNGLMQVASF